MIIDEPRASFACILRAALPLMAPLVTLRSHAVSACLRMREARCHQSSFPPPHGWWWPCATSRPPHPTQWLG